MKFRKKPVVVEAITWDELVAHGVNVCREEGRESSIHNGMAWSFSYKGHPITHENDRCYIIPTLEGSHHMTPDDVLITGVKGEIYPCKLDIFAATYEPAEQTAPATGLQPHQQRVVDEKTELDDRLQKLDAFIKGNPVFTSLAPEEQLRMVRQANAMSAYSEVLGERIAAFN
ncbi:MAG TPA: hypothetical protein VFW49_14855 [Fluviicoccus sp.]|nr:hypothetical protein [Fluviicoccus sp.]